MMYPDIPAPPLDTCCRLLPGYSCPTPGHMIVSPPTRIFLSLPWAHGSFEHFPCFLARRPAPVLDFGHLALRVFHRQSQRHAVVEGPQRHRPRQTLLHRVEEVRAFSVKIRNTMRTCEKILDQSVGEVAAVRVSGLRRGCVPRDDVQQVPVAGSFLGWDADGLGGAETFFVLRGLKQSEVCVVIVLSPDPPSG